MKKFFSILDLVLMAMCCSVVFTSCGDDDDEVVENKNNTIVGSWFIEDINRKTKRRIFENQMAF